MSDPYLPRTESFRDLSPFADPYIASLIENLERTAALEASMEGDASYGNHYEPNRYETGELPPPLDKEDRNQPWEADWSRRHRPRGYWPSR